MNDPERPPLDAITWEQIHQLQHQIDQRNWKLIDEFRIPRFIPPNVPVPPLRPQHFLRLIRSYAAELFKAEADQYDPLLKERSYPAWIARLEERIKKHVLESVEKIQSAETDSGLLAHGVDHHVMVNEVRSALLECGNAYRWMVPGSGVSDQAIKSARAALELFTGEPTPAPTASKIDRPNPSERKATFDAYRSAFPSVGIMDICWAAEQHYREWARWLKGELKDDSRPDRAFRHVLTGGKDAREIRKVQRPKGWK
jgi:hypothetical protein